MDFDCGMYVVCCMIDLVYWCVEEGYDVVVDEFFEGFVFVEDCFD